jgi:signal peptidase I
VQRNDIVVFNFPAGDTVALRKQNPDYYTSVAEYGYDAVHLDKAQYGDIIYRPVDKRENYVKRCVGLPGDLLEIRDNQVYINGKPLANPAQMQFNYYIETDGSLLTEEHFRLLNVSNDDRLLLSNHPYANNLLLYLGFKPNANGRFNPIYAVPLTAKAHDIAQRLPIVTRILLQPDNIFAAGTYPIGYEAGWTRDNYGPIWIPKRGETIPLDTIHLLLYSRCIRNYEGNTLDVIDGKPYINGQPAETYTFRYDYYWMMGDNRHNSADSRSWGFVPEDHIVGKPLFIALSLDKDRRLFDGRIRWHRLFRSANSE